ncbi:type II toxin-antitoxin system RelE/ParE family toxin [Alteromonas marina]|uniref:type II toxin-antitoxin system RelE/ParE family toxin n=1 Tax=unclassified Alteromonas TaxID=2614992 RepID=UPI0012E63F5D|nr:type II toxin-antitoxin system RelE/ParE family toxin [Alteromonas sp. KUL150]GFD74187.1 plasmid stabilization protein [Tenacibaculum sp. KUL113]GFD84541.1 plasmid stabilization protein [Alteromonas sp. KUL150]
MAEIVWTEPALIDLDNIAEYIAVSNLVAAKKLVKEVFAKVDMLEEYPKSEKSVSELPSLNYRELYVKPCQIFHKFEDNKAFILHVMRHEQDLRRFLLD